MKKHYWVGFQKNGYVLDVTVKDETGRKLENWEINGSDEKSKGKVLRILREKFGINLNSKPKIFQDKDLDWLE